MFLIDGLDKELVAAFGFLDPFPLWYAYENVSRCYLFCLVGSKKLV